MPAIRISEYVAVCASGSDISNVNATNSGYDHDLALELSRVGTRGGVIKLSAVGLRDLAEWCEAMALAESDSGNTSGARALRNLAATARKLAK